MAVDPRDQGPDFHPNDSVSGMVTPSMTADNENVPDLIARPSRFVRLAFVALILLVGIILLLALPEWVVGKGILQQAAVVVLLLLWTLASVNALLRRTTFTAHSVVQRNGLRRAVVLEHGDIATCSVSREGVLGITAGDGRTIRVLRDEGNALQLAALLRRRIPHINRTL
jgi:hypothetical protein